MAERYLQLGWAFDTPAQSSPPSPLPRQSPGQRQAAIARRSERTAVAATRSVLVGRDWATSYCERCGHVCSDRHHPAAMGRCKAPRCLCQMATVACTCAHSSADHEAWGTVNDDGCQLCKCPHFTPTRGPRP